jgi:YidC/Oxa1 family membrane protein insertase
VLADMNPLVRFIPFSALKNSEQRVYFWAFGGFCIAIPSAVAAMTLCLIRLRLNEKIIQTARNKMTFLYNLIGTPFGWVMKVIYDIVKDYGTAIIIFTLFTKVLMFPFTWKQQISSERMKAIQPQIAKLRKAYKDNPQKMQQEQMKLYQQEHISMTAGCLPMLIQMILLFGVLDVVYRPLSHILRLKDSAIETARTTAASLTDAAGKHLVTFQGKNDMRVELRIMEAVKEQASAFTENIVDKIHGFSNQLFGIADLTAQPVLKPETWTAETTILMLIPFMAGLFQLISTVYSMQYQKKNNPTMPNMGFMTIMMYSLPLVSVIFAFQVPAGVGFYWAVSALFSFLIQVCMHRFLTPKRVAVIIAREKEKQAAKRPGFLQRAMEEQQRMLEAQNSGKFDSDRKLSNKEINELNVKKIAEARARSADKYSDEITEKKHTDDNFTDEELARIEETKRRMAEKYGDN